MKEHLMLRNSDQIRRSQFLRHKDCRGIVNGNWGCGAFGGDLEQQVKGNNSVACCFTEIALAPQEQKQSMAKEVKLLGFWTSPYVFRVVWALKLKGVDYEYLEEDIFNKSTRLLELNPVHKKVPVLVHDKKVIPESHVILEYIDETWEQNPLLPKDPHERAMARFWAKYGDEKLLKASWKAAWSKGEEKAKAFEESIEALEKIEAEIKEKKYFGGEWIGYLDLAFGWIVYLVPAFEKVGSMQLIEEEKFPAITAWISKFLSHPVIKDNLPPRDELVVYLEGHKEAKHNLYYPKQKEN